MFYFFPSSFSPFFGKRRNVVTWSRRRGRKKIVKETIAPICKDDPFVHLRPTTNDYGDVLYCCCVSLLRRLMSATKVQQSAGQDIISALFSFINS